MTADARDRWITVGVHAFGNLSSSWSVNCACMQRDNEKNGRNKRQNINAFPLLIVVLLSLNVPVCVCVCVCVCVM